MHAIRIWVLPAAAVLLAMNTNEAVAGTAEVRIETSPPVAGGSLRFEGLPAGEVELAADGRASLSREAPAGSHVSRLAWIDPALAGAGYRLAEIVCDDGASASPSHGDVGEQSATFAVEEGEAVACTFRLAISVACACPEEGRWQVDNHAGSMACTGVMSMTLPLAPSKSVGTLAVNGDCSQVRAQGLSDDEAALDMALQPDCSWVGTVGGSQDGIPMVITFRWILEDERSITGTLESNVSHQGMDCEMSRTYELEFEG